MVHLQTKIAEQTCPKMLPRSLETKGGDPGTTDRRKPLKIAQKTAGSLLGRKSGHAVSTQGCEDTPDNPCMEYSPHWGGF